MKKSLEFLIALFTSLLVLSNILSAKLISIGPVLIPGGIICFASAFLISDVINELYGKESGKQAIFIGFVTQIVCSGLTALTAILPGVDSETSAAFDLVMKVNFWSVVASLISFLSASFIDLKIFHTVKSKLRNPKYKWVWNNISTIIGQLVDTTIYVIIAFGLGHELLWTQTAITTLGLMILGQFTVKTILAILDTPIFYWLTK